MAAGQTEAAVMAFRGKSVAGILCSVGAEQALLTTRLQGQQGFALRCITDMMTALTAEPVFEIEDVATNLAGKNFHES